MKKAILTTKVGMTQIFNEDGVLVPVTVLQAGPCVVTQVKTVENDGYSAVQVGFVDKKDKVVNKDASGKKQIVHRHGVNKAEQGHFKKAGVSSKRYVREFKFENAEEYTLGAEIKADIFAAGDKVDASAISKGKGFQGAIKRFGQHRGPMAHGSKFHRHQGSNGACSSPSRVFKGKGMPGHMGCVKVTVQNLEVVRVHMAVVQQLANNRQGTQKAKTRSEVSGGGRKPWRQKGTGHARQGSTRSPQWAGGGVVFAPVPRDYSFKLNKKEKRAALKSALTSKVQGSSLIVVDELKFDEIKTKKFANVMNNLKVEKGLVVIADNDTNVVMSARNVADVDTTLVNTINVYDVMKAKTVVLTKDAVAKIEEVYA